MYCWFEDILYDIENDSWPTVLETLLVLETEACFHLKKEVIVTLLQLPLEKI